MSDKVLYPNVSVRLSGEDGNAFAIIGAVSKALKKADLLEAAKEFQQKAFQSSSYDELLQLCMKTVNVK